ncbi:MAG: hypothetical protein LC657_08205, partial [Desulfobacteraceae bacterium]|nr:hypothetical protein [Desulfobacteraceae bacterium]
MNQQTGEKREFQVLGHGYSFFEKFNPEGLESRPAEESHDEPQVSFDEKKQELRREYSDRGYALYYKVSDESWNLTNNQTRTVGQTGFMAGDIALSLEKEAFLEIDACIDQFENLFLEETSQTEAEADEPGSVPAESVSNVTPETKTKPAILPYKEQFGSGAAKSIGKLLNDLGIAQDVADSKDYYARIENGEYMDLVIEKHSDELFLTHYYEQNGDLIMDNELVFKVNEETGHLIFKEVALQNPKGGEIRAYDKGFANMFAKNIIQQGFGEGKILHTTMSEANRMQEDEEQADPADVKDEANQDTAPEKRPYYEFKNETWQDYEPGQLPYYELGGKPIDAEDIEPYAQEILEKLARYKATEEKNLDFYISKYKEVAEKGIEAVSEEDRQDMSDDKAVATALFLEHSHIAYSKGYLAAIDAVFFEMDAQQNIPDTQKENVAVAPEKIAFTDKSVSDNIQRAVIDNGEIEIINKSGRKIVSRKTFSLEKWESLSKSFGNPEYNKREFVKSLGLVKDDGTPESDSLKQRIIDSQVRAIDTVYKEFKAGQAPQEKPADDTLPDGWNESSSNGMITNKDPISGGIIDSEIVSGKWFVIPENNHITKLEGFDTRAEAYNALMSQVDNLSNVVVDFNPTTPEGYAK